MLRVFKISFISIAIIILCVGCTIKDSLPYTLEYDGNKCYMTFVSNKKNETNNSCIIMEPGLECESLSDLKDSLLNYKFTEEQLNKIRSDFSTGNNKKIQICNPNKLYQAICPKNIKFNYFHWNGLTYYWSPDENSSLDTSFSYIKKDSYDYNLKKEYYNYDSDKTITKTEKTADRNATVYYYTTWSGEYKRICYVLEQEEKTLHIAEEYTLKSDIYNNRVDKYISLYIMGKHNGEHFYVKLHANKRPSVEYLLEFGLKELDNNDIFIKWTIPAGIILLTTTLKIYYHKRLLHKKASRGMP